MATTDEIKGWLAGRIPGGWFEGAPEINADRDEVLVVGRLPDVKLEGATPDALDAARAGRIKQHREDTRDLRIQMAQESQKRFGRHVSWGARCGERTELFTHLSIPVMTRLRLNERQLLDTLVEAGIARSRSDALAWCARLVAKHENAWLEELKESLADVRRVRSANPLH